MKSNIDFKVGDLVEVLNKQEILKTLDKSGKLDGLPFMPEMFQFCGQRFRVLKSAHKTCDTVFPIRGRRMADAVHLGNRCDGQSHGGCEASCLIFWKTAWLRRIEQGDIKKEPTRPGDVSASMATGDEQKVNDGIYAAGSSCNCSDPAYSCQATQLPYATTNLNRWDLKQYLEDYASGNVGLPRMVRGFIYITYHRLIKLGIGLGPPLRWVYDAFQSAWGGLPYPRRVGTVKQGDRTPTERLELQPGEFVRVKTYSEILATCDQNNKNRGMIFDGEMVPYCGGTYKVLKRVSKIINEQSGKMQRLPNPCIILDSVICEARYSECRLFCPRSIYPYWREIWLERVSALPQKTTSLDNAH